MNNSKTRFNKILLSMFLILALLILIAGFLQPKIAYADEIIQTKSASLSYGGDLGHGYAVPYCSKTTIKLVRESKDTFHLEGSWTTVNAPAGILSANCSFKLYKNNSKGTNLYSSSVDHWNQGNTSHNFKSEPFTHSDKNELTIYIENSNYNTSNGKWYKATITFDAYDNTSPTISTTGNITNSTTKEKFTVNASDNKDSYPILYVKTPTDNNFINRGKSFTNNSKSPAGIYEYYAQDESGNVSSTNKIEYKTPTPTGTLKGVTNGGITNSDVSFSWTQNNDVSVSVTHKRQTTTYTNGNITLSDNGFYSITITDNKMFYQKNSNTYSFEIDKTAPTGTLKGVVNEGITNNDVSFNTNETDCTVTLDNQLYKLNTPITTEKLHTIIITDEAGNSTKYTFTIDKTAPTGTLKGVTNGGIANNNVSFSWIEETATATLNGEPYTKNSLIKGVVNEEKGYTLILKDTAGNTTKYTFKINLIKPTGKLNNITNKALNITNQTVTFTWSSLENATATLNGNPYISGTNIEAQGKYTIVLTNNHNNSTTYSFEIDKTAPTGTLKGVVNGGITNQDVYFLWTDTNATALLNNTPYRHNTKISAEGKYNIVLTDTAGNSTSYSFEIDKTAPTGTLNNVVNGGITNKNVSFTWVEDTASATLNGVLYNRNDLITLSLNQRKDYTLILKDVAGNSTTYNFTIDKIAPTLKLTTITGKELKINSEDNTYYYNDNVLLEYDSTDTITINDVFFKENILLSQENKTNIYNITIQNKLGNTNNYKLIIDTKLPTENLEAIKTISKNYINHWWETYDVELINNKYMKKNTYSFDSYEKARAYAIAREEKTREYGQYNGGQIYCNYAKKYVNSDENLATNIGNNYYIYKDINNPNNLLAYFNIAKLNEAVNKYATESINEKMIPSTPAQEYEKNTVFNNLLYISKKNFELPNNFDGTYTLIINGIKYNYTQKLTDGVNSIIETDKAGNSISYVIYIDTTPPKAIVTDCSGNGSSPSNPISWIDNLTTQLNTQSEVRFDKEFRIAIKDDMDSNAILKITNDHKSIVLFMKENENIYYNFKESGKYTIEWSDKVGNYKSVNLILSLDLPVANIVENRNELGKIQSFDLAIDTILPFNSIVNIDVEYSVDGTENSYTKLNNGTVPSFNFVASKNRYNFTVNGYYKFTLYDNFGRIIKNEKPYLLQKNKPIGVFVDSRNQAIANNSVTNKRFKFTWQEPASCKVTLTLPNGEKQLPQIFESSLETTYFNIEGSYLVELTDKGNNTSIYEITIDVTPLVYTLENVKPNGKTNKNVVLSWDNLKEPNAKAYVKDENGKYQYCENGTIFSNEQKYEILLKDRAGNIEEFNFIIDKTPPIVSIVTYNGRQIAQGSCVNYDFVKFVWNGESATAWVNGSIYEEGQKIYEDGTYSLVLEDYLGNRAYSNITIDKTLNEGSLIGVANGGITNKDVIFNWKDLDAKATLNGKEYLANTKISIEDGTEQKFEIILFDKAGNSLTYNFTISKVAPIIYLVGVTDGGKTNTSVKVNGFEDYYTATLNDQPFKIRQVISDEGSYQLKVVDTRTGNYKIYSFEIDKTAPAGELLGVANGSITNKSVSFTWDELGAKATLNGEPYEKNTLIFEENIYSIYLYDTVNNQSIEYTFEIDKTAPVGELFGVANGEVSNKSCKFVWYDNKATATLNGEPYEKNTLIKEDNFYTIVLTDIAGNSTKYTFTIDKTKPYALFKNEQNVYLNVQEYYNYNIIIEFDKNVTALLNNEPISSGKLINTDGNYNLSLVNQLGSATDYFFTIDTVAPTGTLVGVNNNEITNGNVSFIYYSPATATLNGEPYISGTKIEEENDYKIILTDRAGNTSEYYFSIYKILPTANAVGLNKNNITNTDVYFEIENIFTATLNGEPYISGTLIKNEGTYELIVKNKLGIEKSYTFEIDKTAPIIKITNNLNVELTNLNINVPFYIVSEENCEITINSNEYKNNLIKTNGLYHISVMDIAGNISDLKIELDTSLPTGIFSSQLVNNSTGFDLYFYFASDCTAILDNEPYTSDILITCPLGQVKKHTIVLTNKYGSENSYTFTIDKTAPEGILKGVSNCGIANNDVSFTFDSLDRATLNDEPYNSRDIITGVEGSVVSYTLMLYNRYNISAEYTFTIDKEAPTGILTNVINGGSSNKDISFTWQDEEATATLNNKPYNKEEIIKGEENKLYNYTIILTDTAGNSTEYKFTIDKRLPFLNKKIPDGIIQQDITILFDSDRFTATLNDVAIDSQYIINKTGDYTLILKDSIGNSSTYEFTVDKTLLELPIVIDGEEKILTNNIKSDKAVTINSKELITVNGEQVSDGYVLNQVGTYTVVLTTEKGLTKEFTIEIIEPNIHQNLINTLLIVFVSIVAVIVVIALVLYIVKTTKINKKRII